MTTTTNVSELKINKLTKAQFETIEPSATELYYVTDDIDELPSQTGQAGKFLTNDGSILSWGVMSGSEDANINVLPSSGTINLTDNSINKITPTGSVTFNVPGTSPVTLDNTKFHQILIQMNLQTPQTIDLTTPYYFNESTPDLSETGKYNILYEYDNNNEVWVVGAMPKTIAEE